MLSPKVEGRARRQNLRSVLPSDQDVEKNHGETATITKSFAIGFYRILVAMALIFEQCPRSTCLVMRHGPLFRSRFDCNPYHHPLSNSRSRLLHEIDKRRTKQTEFSWSASASVRDLFEVLDEECDDINNSNDDDIEEEEMEEEQNELLVSDAEALLACWSYLKRRKRLGDWKEYEERKSQSLLSQNYFLIDDEEGDSILDGYDDDYDDERETHQKVLEDSDESLDFDNINDEDITTVQDILLASSSPVNDNLGLGGDADDEAGVAQDLITISSFVSKTEGSVSTKGGGAEKSGEKEDIDLWHTEFTSFPKEANPSRTRRVDAMKRRWEDPEYRKRWYEKRWGSKSSHQGKKDIQQTDRERQAVQRARDLPSGFLGSHELASMTEEEIAEAIRTRILSTRKRVTSRKETLQRRRDLLAMQIESLEALSEEDGDINFEKGEEPREILFSPNEKSLKEAQRKRSERAKKLYATRLENQKRDNESESTESSSSTSALTSKTKRPPRKKGRYFPPKQLTPRDAFLRIENDLDHSVKPSIDDVRLVLQPGKMKDRKLLLCRILEDEFNLAGRCVPPLPNKGNETEDDFDAVNDFDVQELAFVKRCTIERLGNFVIRLLETGE